jgi:hypothetical protein
VWTPALSHILPSVPIPPPGLSQRPDSIRNCDFLQGTAFVNGQFCCLLLHSQRTPTSSRLFILASILSALPATHHRRFTNPTGIPRPPSRPTHSATPHHHSTNIAAKSSSHRRTAEQAERDPPTADQSVPSTSWSMPPPQKTPVLHAQEQPDGSGTQQVVLVR